VKSSRAIFKQRKLFTKKVIGMKRERTGGKITVCHINSKQKNNKRAKILKIKLVLTPKKLCCVTLVWRQHLQL
jgi:hypothetical protein